MTEESKSDSEPPHKQRRLVQKASNAGGAAIETEVQTLNLESVPKRKPGRPRKILNFAEPTTSVAQDPGSPSNAVLATTNVLMKRPNCPVELLKISATRTSEDVPYLQSLVGRLVSRQFAKVHLLGIIRRMVRDKAMLHIEFENCSTAEMDLDEALSALMPTDTLPKCSKNARGALVYGYVWPPERAVSAAAIEREQLRLVDLVAAAKKAALEAEKNRARAAVIAKQDSEELARKLKLAKDSEERALREAEKQLQATQAANAAAAEAAAAKSSEIIHSYAPAPVAPPGGAVLTWSLMMDPKKSKKAFGKRSGPVCSALDTVHVSVLSSDIDVSHYFPPSFPVSWLLRSGQIVFCLILKNKCFEN